LTDKTVKLKPGMKPMLTEQQRRQLDLTVKVRIKLSNEQSRLSTRAWARLNYDLNILPKKHKKPHEPFD